MPEFHFADGFDVSEPLAFGLTPAQLVVAVLGLLVDYLDLRSGLPRPIAIPLAVAVTAVGAALALGRRDGRPVVEWAGIALRFALRPRRGRFHAEMSVITAAIAMPRPDAFVPPAAGSLSPPERLETRRRAPLVLLPTSAYGGPDGGAAAEPAAPGPAANSYLEVADVAPPAPAAGAATSEWAVTTALPPSGGVAVGASPRLQVSALPDLLTPGAPSGRPAASWPPVFAGATRRFTFFSLSGGVGRTTLATEVAALLAGRGRHHDPVTGLSRPLRVALLDLDGRSPCVGLRLGIGHPSVSDWLLDGASTARLDQHLVGHGSGLRALLGPALPSGPTPRPEQVAGIVEALERQGAHFVIADIGAGLGAVNEWVLQCVHEIFVTITPTTRGLQDAYRSTEVLRRLGFRHKLHYVVNRSRGGVDLDETMGDLGGRIDAEIPEDEAVGAAELGHQLVGLDGEGPAAMGFRQLAAVIYPAIEDGVAGRIGSATAEPGWRRFALGRRRRAG